VPDFDYYPDPVPDPNYFPDSAHHFDHPNSVPVDCLAYSYYPRIAATCYQRSSHNALVAAVAAESGTVVVAAEPQSEPDAFSAVVATARVYKRHHRYNLGSQARSGFDLCNLKVDWVFFVVVDLVATCWLVDYFGCFVGSGYFVGRFGWFDCRIRCFGWFGCCFECYSGLNCSDCFERCPCSEYYSDFGHCFDSASHFVRCFARCFVRYIAHFAR